MANYYQWSKDHPFHLSVGAVVMNSDGLIACHHYTEFLPLNISKDSGGFYILMRETLEMGETIEQALHRGLSEEFGITAKIVTFVGSIITPIMRKEVEAQKTTIYFLVEPLTFEPEKRADDIENSSEIEWKSPEFLLSEMPKQSVRLNHKGVDESSVITSALSLWGGKL